MAFEKPFVSNRLRRLCTDISDNPGVTAISELLENDPGQISDFASSSLNTCIFVYQCIICKKIFQTQEYLYNHAALWHEKRQNAPATEQDIKKNSNIRTVTAQLLSFGFNRSKLKKIGRKILLEYQKPLLNITLNLNTNENSNKVPKKLLTLLNENFPERYEHYYVSPFCTSCKKLTNYEVRK